MLLLLYMIFFGGGWLNHQLTTKFAFSDVPLGLCLKPFSVRDFPHVFSGILSPTPWRQLQWLTSLQGRWCSTSVFVCAKEVTASPVHGILARWCTGWPDSPVHGMHLHSWYSSSSSSSPPSSPSPSSSSPSSPSSCSSTLSWSTWSSASSSSSSSSPSSPSSCSSTLSLSTWWSASSSSSSSSSSSPSSCSSTPSWSTLVSQCEWSCCWQRCGSEQNLPDYVASP